MVRCCVIWHDRLKCGMVTFRIVWYVVMLSCAMMSFGLTERIVQLNVLCCY